MAYDVRFDPETRRRRDRLTARQRGLLRDAVARHLLHEAERQTRNRFPMGPNRLATWEVRLGQLRVFYDVEGQTVRIRAVGVKQGNRPLIAGQEVDTHA
jgi:mRNA-degrading endonuclease RelE of RelBE toxin-antitoxin system